jgi:hypothetical protein
MKLKVQMFLKISQNGEKQIPRPDTKDGRGFEQHKRKEDEKKTEAAGRAVCAQCIGVRVCERVCLFVFVSE